MIASLGRMLGGACDIDCVAQMSSPAASSDGADCIVPHWVDELAEKDDRSGRCSPRSVVVRARSRTIGPCRPRGAATTVPVFNWGEGRSRSAIQVRSYGRHVVAAACLPFDGPPPAVSCGAPGQFSCAFVGPIRRRQAARRLPSLVTARVLSSSPWPLRRWRRSAGHRQGNDARVASDQ